jgi:hypothetical protein
MCLAVRMQVGQPSLPAQVPVIRLTVETDELFHAPPNKPGTFVGLPKTTKPSDLGGIPGRRTRVQKGVSPQPL